MTKKLNLTEDIEDAERRFPKVMGLAEVAEHLGWKKQHVTTYLNRAETKGFHEGSFPQPIQRISSGWLWLASDIEEYKKSREL